MIRVGVLGARGKMGSEVCAAVAGDPDLQLVAAVDPNGAGESICGVMIDTRLDALAESGSEVVVDFTHPSAVVANIEWCVRNGIHVVCGTTGMTGADHDRIRALIDEHGGKTSVFVAPNFAIGAVLMMRFAAVAARFLPDVEIVELHHDGKADAPSGTALKTAEEIAKARTETHGVTMGETQPGARGADADGIRVHSIRLPGLVAHQEVLFGGPGQTLSIRHDTTDRKCFMPGVLLAIKALRDRPGLTIGLDSLMEL